MNKKYTKWTYEAVKTFVESLGFILLEMEKINNYTKVVIKDSNGYIYNSFVSWLQGGFMPRIVDQSNQFSIDNIKKWLILNNVNLILLSDKYINSSDNLIFIDNEGYKYYTAWDNLKAGKLPRFIDTKNIFSIDNINLWLIKNNKKFSLISNHYTGVNDLLECKCEDSNCSEIFNKDWSHIQRGQECPFCNNSKVGSKNNLAVTHPYLIDEWDFETNKLSPTEITYGTTKSFNWICKKCKYKWKASANSRTNSKSGCPECASLSKGRDKAKEILETLSIIYETEYRFSDCRDILPLPFDFYLPNNSICIEVDGTQHKKPVKFFGGEEKFQITKSHDLIKTKYCEDKNIILIRIEYKRIEDIINKLPKMLNKYNIILSNDLSNHQLQLASGL